MKLKTAILWIALSCLAFASACDDNGDEDPTRPLPPTQATDTDAGLPTAPGGTSTTPTDGEATPTDGQATPTDGQATPTDGQATPTDGEATPTDGEATPTDGEATPTDGEATPSNECETNEDCSGPGQTCENFECVDPECVDNEGCAGPGQTCENFECVDPECVDNEGCEGLGFTCQEFECVPPQCLANDGCDEAAGEVCENFVCVAPECLENEDCEDRGEGFTCEGRVCVAPECTTSSDCTDPGEACVAFECVPAPVGSECDPATFPQRCDGTTQIFCDGDGEVAGLECGEFGDLLGTSLSACVVEDGEATCLADRDSRCSVPVEDVGTFFFGCVEEGDGCVFDAELGVRLCTPDVGDCAEDAERTCFGAEDTLLIDACLPNGTPFVLDCPQISSSMTCSTEQEACVGGELADTCRNSDLLCDADLVCSTDEPGVPGTCVPPEFEGPLPGDPCDPEDFDSFCLGTSEVFCSTLSETVVAFSCSDFGDAVGTELVACSEELGPDGSTSTQCLVADGAACTFDSELLGGRVAFGCAGADSGCVFEPVTGDRFCTPGIGDCDATPDQSCYGDDSNLLRQGCLPNGTPTVLNCDFANTTCSEEADACTNAPQGNFCIDGLILCVEDLECVGESETAPGTCLPEGTEFFPGASCDPETVGEFCSDNGEVYRCVDDGDEGGVIVSGLFDDCPFLREALFDSAPGSVTCGSIANEFGSADCVLETGRQCLFNFGEGVGLRQFACEGSNAACIFGQTGAPACALSDLYLGPACEDFATTDRCVDTHFTLDGCYRGQPFLFDCRRLGATGGCLPDGGCLSVQPGEPCGGGAVCVEGLVCDEEAGFCEVEG